MLAEEFRGARVTVMGLGLHGGGVASARFFARMGARVTVTDLRSPDILAPSLKALEEFDIRYVLGQHREEDFAAADIVIKNPAVRADSPFLQKARRVETDISIFLAHSQSPLIAVTGSKGKSTTASALAHVLREVRRPVLLGGNITVSPLDFLEQTSPDVTVVLELSSWQLGDLRGKGILKPRIAILTCIYPDHLDYYGSMEAYVADKKVLFESLEPESFAICNADQEWSRFCVRDTRANILWFHDSLSSGLETTGLADIAPAFGGWLAPQSSSNGQTARPHDSAHTSLAGYGRLPGSSEVELLVPAELKVPGMHQKMNLLAAALGLRAYGIGAEEIASALACFPGIPHRLEYVASCREVHYYNDSAATIPDAAIAAVESFEAPVILIAGGSDKKSDFSAFADKASALKRLILLAGSGTDRLIPLLNQRRVPFLGPFGSMAEAVHAASQSAREGDVVLLSPGCASFGMFLHEFARGDAFREAVRQLCPAEAQNSSPAQGQG